MPSSAPSSSKDIPAEASLLSLSSGTADRRHRMGDCMPYRRPSKSHPRYVEHLKEESPMVLASPEDADYFRKTFKPTRPLLPCLRPPNRSVCRRPYKTNRSFCLRCQRPYGARARSSTRTRYYAPVSDLNLSSPKSLPRLPLLTLSSR